MRRAGYGGDPNGDKFLIAGAGDLGVYSGESGERLMSFEYESGRSGVVDPTLENYGPTPPGRYSIAPENVAFNGPRTLSAGDWGLMRARLDPYPETQTFGRNGFYLHGGLSPGTAGCLQVSVGDDLRLLLSLRRNPGLVDVFIGKP